MSQGIPASPSTLAQIADLWGQGLLLCDIALRLDLHPNTVRQYARAQGLPPRRNPGNPARRRGYGMVNGVSRSGTDGWSVVDAQLDRIALLDRAKSGQRDSLNVLRAMGLRYWQSGNTVVLQDSRP